MRIWQLPGVQKNWKQQLREYSSCRWVLLHEAKRLVESASKSTAPSAAKTCKTVKIAAEVCFFLSCWIHRAPFGLLKEESKLLNSIKIIKRYWKESGEVGGGLADGRSPQGGIHWELRTWDRIRCHWELCTTGVSFDAGGWFVTVAPLLWLPNLGLGLAMKIPSSHPRSLTQKWESCSSLDKDKHTNICTLSNDNSNSSKVKWTKNQAAPDNHRRRPWLKRRCNPPRRLPGCLAHWPAGRLLAPVKN